MTTLAPNLRKQLERVVVEAREVAEAGAQATLEALAVHYREPYAHMSSEECSLRRRLRAHGRQVGDRRDVRSGNQAIDRLVHECAYEHWHGMLFARFLAENHLLIEPEHGVAVTLKDCEALAKDVGIDRWALAAQFAHRMLPQVFRPDHAVLKVRFAREHRLKLEGLVESLPADVFVATDSLGWVYQFWQSRKKDEVNRSEVKIGANELPAVTQLFTEPYMVNFLLDNSLGAWWAARRLSDSDLKDAGSEPELREKAGIPGVPLDYLRFVQCEDTADRAGWRLASSAFERWPENLGELKVLDPCCGSGHFLVAALLMLVPMRMEREELTARDAVNAVLRENLHGLELDQRCVELAAFALALAAWCYPDSGGYRALPDMNIACSGLAPNATKEQWIALAEQAAAAGGMPPERDLLGVDDSLLSAPLRNSLEVLYDLFKQAPERGSLINPRALKSDLLQRDYDSVRSLFAVVLKQEQTTDEQAERAVAAQGMARAAELLAGRYQLVITNVPYLARGKQSERLRTFCEQHYPAAKNDLATVFLERCLELCEGGGTASLVLPQNWLFLTSYRKLREKLLKAETWCLLARLGPGAFETISGEVVKAILLTLNRDNPSSHPGGLLDETTDPSTMHGLDVSESRTARDKAAQLTGATIQSIEQARQLGNPDARVTLEETSAELLEQHATAYQGISTGDNPARRRLFWEQPKSIRWVHFHSTVGDTISFGGMQSVLDWANQGNDMAALRGRGAWGRWGVAISQMRALPVAIFGGERFDTNMSALPAEKICHLPAIWCFCSSPEYSEAVRRTDQSLKVTNATLVKVPFDLDHWTKVADERYPNGLPLPYSNDPTQWIFHGHPCGSVVWNDGNKWTATGQLRTKPTVLQVAMVRLLGYRWPAEWDAEMELADEQREWVRRCDALLDHADKDGIVCIPSVRGEAPAGERLLALLATAFGNAWDNGVLTKLLDEAGSPSLDDWLRNRFFGEHCKLFHHRPFAWHIWDGRTRDGFHALVNYHKLAAGGGKGRQCLESLTYSYLGAWIARQRDGVNRGEGGAEDRLAAALELQKRLIAILEGEPPFDIFVRWKPINQQPIGWAPDINDGVRLNIRPFMAADITGGRKGAGILRAKPNIHWRKDRGKEPSREQEHFPWFWREGEFTVDRVNEFHLTIAEKSQQFSTAKQNRP